MREQLHIDWTRCQGRGSCMELLPELITPDDWGYPMGSIPNRPLDIPQDLLKLARRAVKECPRLALSVIEREATTR